MSIAGQLQEAEEEAETLRTSERHARGKLASFCEGASKMIQVIDTLPEDADSERCQTLLRETASRLRAGVMTATDGAAPNSGLCVKNEACDELSNAIQWLRNCQDGTSSFEVAIADMYRALKRIREFPDPPRVAASK